MDTYSLAAWEGLTLGEQEAVAKRLARELPEGFVFRSVDSYELGGQRRSAAHFELDGAAFVVVSGGTFTVGYDAGREWEPTQDELESWEGTAEEYGIDGTIREYVAGVTLRPRAVRVPPLLVEVRPSELGWEELSEEDPEVRDIVSTHLGSGS